MSSTLARQWVRLQAIDALRNIPGLEVVTPGTWDSVPRFFPEAKVRTPSETKTSTNRAPVQFTTLITLGIQLHVQADTEENAQTAIEDLSALAEKWIFGYAPLVQQVQQFARVVTQTQVDTSGEKPVAWATLAIDVELFEDFDPVDMGTVHTDALQTIATTVVPNEAVDTLNLTIALPQ